MANNSSEQIRFDIIFNTRAALDEIAAMSNAADNLEQRVTKFGNYLIQSSKKWGVPIKELTRDFRALDAEMKAAGEKGGLPEGIFPGQNIDEILGLTDGYVRATQAANGFRVNQQGVVTSIGQVVPAVQKLNMEITKLQKPARNTLGQFAGGSDFEKQFKSLSTYQDKLRLVQNTISDLAQKSGSSFKDAGTALTKAFPNLIKDTNLATVATENLTKANQQLSASFRTEAEMIQLVQMQLTRMQQTGRLTLMGGRNQQIEQLKSVIREVSEGTGAQYHQVANQLEKIGIPAAQANAAVKGLNTELTKGTRDAQGFSHGIDVVRTALGTLTAVAIFTALTAITDFFRGAIDQARQFEETLYRIGNAERQLSQAGIEVSVEGLRKGIEDIQKALPIFSKEDTAQLIGGLATTTKELGLAEDQIVKLGAAIAILNINSSETESLLQTQGKVTNALISPQARSVGNLGLAFGKLKMEAVGAQIGINKTLEEMSDAEKTKIKLQIIFETAGLDQIDDISKLREEIQKGGGDFAALNDYLNSNTARLAQNGAAWKDLQTTVGQVFLPMLPSLTSGIEFLTNSFNGLKFVIIEVSALFSSLFGAIQAIMDAPLDQIGDIGKIFSEAMTKGFEESRKNLVNKFFPEGIPESASQAIKDLYEPLINPPRETGTNPYENLVASAKDAAEVVKDNEEKINEIFAQARDKRAQIDEEYRRKIEDANRDHAQKMQDIAREVERKQDDAQRNYFQKVDDINRDANEKIAEANEDARQKEVDREKEYQNKLRELRERFLLDLEDALRARDARQVLRLLKEYQLNKKNLEEKRKLDRKEAKEDLARKIADIEQERQLKLEAARRELAEKQAEIALWAERERQDAQIALQRKLADARLWHQRELAEYQQYLQRKLQELARAIMKEYQLTAAGAAAIYNLLRGYFGSSGMIANLLSSGLTNSLNGIVTSFSSSSSGGSTASPTWAAGGFYGAAQGGTFIATRPTRMLVGEAGMERVSVTPLSRVGSDANKVFTDGQGASGANGNLSLRISLSNGLVAEIVETSLESVATTIERIGREK